jgi:hypothetical protein
MVCLRIFLWFFMLSCLVPPMGGAFSEPTKPPKKRATLQIFENDPLVFGTVLAIRGPAKIIVYPNGKRDVIGDIDLKPNDLYGPARLSITGERNTQVNMSLDPKIPLLPISAPPKPTATLAQAQDFVLFSTKISQISDVARLNYFGMDTVFIGATLSLSPESPVGRYSLVLSPVLEYRGGDNASITLP